MKICIRMIQECGLGNAVLVEYLIGCTYQSGPGRTGSGWRKNPGKYCTAYPEYILQTVLIGSGKVPRPGAKTSRVLKQRR